MARQVKPWPAEARPHYIKLFGLSERLRAHLMVAQELALSKRLISYQKQLIENEGILRNIYPLLEQMQEQAQYMRDIYEPTEAGGAPPKWYRIATRIEFLTRRISEKMSLIELDLINLLDVAVIKKTTEVLLDAQEIRDKQLSLPLDQAEIAHDKHGLQIIIDLAQSHVLDLRIWQLRPISTKR